MANATSNTPVTPAPVVNTPKSTGGSKGFSSGGQLTGTTRAMIQQRLDKTFSPIRVNMKDVLSKSQDGSSLRYAGRDGNQPSMDMKKTSSDSGSVPDDDTTPTGTSGTDSTPTDNSNEGQSKETVTVVEAQQKADKTQQRADAFHEKIKDPALTMEEKIALFEQNSDILTPAEQELLKNMKEQKEQQENAANKNDPYGKMENHNADEENGDDEKFKIQEGDIIDWMMKEVILASAEWAGNKLAKGTGLLLVGGLEGAGKISKSGAEWTWEKAKDVYKYITKDKVYPTDTTGNACKEADEMAKQYSEKSEMKLDSYCHPWEVNDWENDDTKKSFTNNLNNGQLYDVALMPEAKEAHDIDITTMDDIKKNAVISPELKKEMVDVMLAAPNQVEGVDESKIKAIKDALSQENGPDLQAMKTIVDSFTKEEKEKYDASLKETLQTKVGNVDDYAVKKIKEQKETQDVYNQAKTARYYQAISDGDKDALKNIFISKENPDMFQNIEKNVENMKNNGVSEKDAWNSTSMLMRKWHASAVEKNNFASLYASTMLKQKHIEGGANTNEETRKAEFNELLKEGRAVYRVAVVGGLVEEMTNNLSEAAKLQEKRLCDGKYIEKTKEQPKENKYLKDVASLAEHVKGNGQELIGKEGISLQQEAKNQNKPIDNYTMDDLGKCKTLAEDWKEKRAQNKAHIKSILYGANQYTGQNVYIPNQKGRGN